VRDWPGRNTRRATGSQRSETPSRIPRPHEARTVVVRNIPMASWKSIVSPDGLICAWKLGTVSPSFILTIASAQVVTCVECGRCAARGGLKSSGRGDDAVMSIDEEAFAFRQSASDGSVHIERRVPLTLFSQGACRHRLRERSTLRNDPACFRTEASQGTKPTGTSETSSKYIWCVFGRWGACSSWSWAGLWMPDECATVERMSCDNQSRSRACHAL
jgi:hypothetical protein